MLKFTNLNFKVFFTAISRIKQDRSLIFSTLPYINLPKRNIGKKLKLCWVRLPNPNFKVFFIAISKIKKVRRLIWYLTCFYLNLNRYWKRNLKYVEVVFQFQILMSSSQLFKELSKLWVCNLHFTLKKHRGDKKENVNQVNQINQENQIKLNN